MSTEVGSSPHPRLVLAATTLANALLGIAGVILGVTSSRSKNKVVSDLG
jgi:hypothetical protein